MNLSRNTIIAIWSSVVTTLLLMLGFVSYVGDDWWPIFGIPNIILILLYSAGIYALFKEKLWGKYAVRAASAVILTLVIIAGFVILRSLGELSFVFIASLLIVGVSSAISFILSFHLGDRS